MALRQYINGEFFEVGSISKRINNETKPLSALYVFKENKMIPIWEAGNFRTADGKIFQTSDYKIFNVTM